jgi:hypothetical protein
MNARPRPRDSRIQAIAHRQRTRIACRLVFTPLGDWAGLVHGEIDGPRTCYCADPHCVERLRVLLDRMTMALTG